MIIQAKINKILCIEDIEKLIAIIYIFLLPIRMISQLSFFSSALHGAGGFLDVLLHLLGLMLMFISTRGKITFFYEETASVMKTLVIMVAYFNISSVIMATYIQFSRGNYAGESAFSGILGMIIYFAQYALMMVYNYRVFQILSIQQIKKIINLLVDFLMLLGLYQVLVYAIGEPFRSFILRIDVCNVLMPAHNMEKLSLTLLEGASAGTLIAVLVMPYLYSNVLYEGVHLRYIIRWVLWLPIIYYTKSSTAYITFVLATLVFGVLFLKKMKYQEKGVAIICIVFFVVLFALSLYCLGYFSSDAWINLWYLFVQKIFDKNHSSRAERVIPLYINWGAFKEFPLFGCGNGLQGYFFKNYFPTYVMYVPGTRGELLLKEGLDVLSNGALFLPGILSGYGLFGFSFWGMFVYKLSALAQRGKRYLNIFYYMYIIAVISLMPALFLGDLCGKYYIWFVLSLPLMYGAKEKE